MHQKGGLLMIMKAITCPHCGGDLKEFKINTVQICPYCKRPVYASDEGGHFSYTKKIIKEDKTRMREVEAEEKRRNEEINFKREKVV